MKIAHIAFPEIQLPARQAHHLRGYFGRLFQEHSPLLHNHLEGGGYRYAYPLVQYKVIDNIPELVGVGEGAELLVDLFLRIRELDIEGRVYPLAHKHLECQELEAGYSGQLSRYEFKTLWMALNQENHQEFIRQSPPVRQQTLERLLRNHLLAAFKGMGVWLKEDQRILCRLENVEQRFTSFKNQQMLAFGGSFITNAVLPSRIGIGKAVSRGFGTIAGA